MNITLDHNCLINLESGEGQSAALKDLIALHDAGAMCVHIGVISASENVVGGGEPSYAAFAGRIERLGLGRLPQVLPEMRWGMSYFDCCVFGLPDKVREIIHPTSNEAYEQFAAAYGVAVDGPIHRKWRNMTCDVDGIVAHIRQGHDVFVTEDGHFLDRRDVRRSQRQFQQLRLRVDE